MIDEKKITEAVNAYIGYPKEIDEGVGTSMRRDAFRDEYAEQHIISMEQFGKLQENLYSQEAVVPEPPQAPQPNSTFDYAQMTRQQRRAYERRLAKENKRKY